MTLTFHAANSWPPSTEEALAAAAKTGLLNETHTVDIKRELPAGDAANKELAADIASFAIDGGYIFIGVDEDHGAALAPVQLDGLAERIEQVARTRIDEPVNVTSASIASITQPGRGYLVVRVPASPRAPHMASHRYWARGDKTKYPMSDSQVELLMAQRAAWAANAGDLLLEWMAQDPIAEKSRENGHLFVVASPVPPRERFLLPVFTAPWLDPFKELLSATKRAGPQFQPDFPDSLSNFSRTPNGWAGSSYAVFVQRDGGRGREDGMLKVEISEDGVLRLMCGRATVDQQQTPLDSTRLVFDELCLGLTARMVSLAGRVSEKAGFLGSWDFGVGLTGLTSTVSAVQWSRTHWRPENFYPDDRYSATTRADVTQIEASAGHVVEQLLGRLMRALSCDDFPDVKRHFA